MLLVTLKEPPPRGSVQSIILQALLLKKDQIEYMKVRAIVQAITNKEAAQSGLDAYRDTQFPYLKTMQTNDRDAHVAKLLREVAKGPIAVTPHIEKRIKSRLKTRVVERTKEERMAAANRISNKLSKGYI